MLQRNLRALNSFSVEEIVDANKPGNSVILEVKIEAHAP